MNQDVKEAVAAKDKELAEMRDRLSRLEAMIEKPKGK